MSPLCRPVSQSCRLHSPRASRTAPRASRAAPRFPRASRAAHASREPAAPRRVGLYQISCMKVPLFWLYRRFRRLLWVSAEPELKKFLSNFISQEFSSWEFNIDPAARSAVCSTSHLHASPVRGHAYPRPRAHLPPSAGTLTPAHAHAYYIRRVRLLHLTRHNLLRAPTGMKKGPPKGEPRKGGCRRLLLRHYYEKVYLKSISWLLCF